MTNPRTFVGGDLASRILPVVCAVAISTLLGTDRAEAQGTSPISSPSTEFSFGMVGLGAGQTARLKSSTSALQPVLLFRACWRWRFSTATARS